MVREFGYEYDAEIQEDLWQNTKDQVTFERFIGAYCLRSGRDALKAIAREFSPRTVLLPALSCDSMVSPFERYGHRIRFYRLNSDYTANMNDIEEAAGEDSCMLLYMDYFGNKAISNEKERNLRRNHADMILIEDRTHDLIWNRSNSFQPDYIIASIRKWLAVPDGGLLWGKLKISLAQEISFVRTRLKAQGMRHEYLENGNEDLKTEYRRIFSTVSDILDHDEPAAMSLYSYNIIQNTDWNEIRNRRKQNAEILSAILAPHVKLIQSDSNASSLYVPFLIPNRDKVQKELSAKGIFNTVIWPLSEIQRKICQTARETEQSMLAAPCDQRYTTNDMEYIGNEIVKVVEKTNG